MVFLFLILIISFLVSYFLLNFYYNNYNNYLVAKPNNRSSHIKETPTGAGIIFASVGTIACFLLGNTFLIYSYPLAVIGLLDDKLNLSRLLRFFSQIIFSVVILLNSNINSLINLLPNIFLQILLKFSIIFLMVGIINLINFMDGIDGLIAICFIAFLLFATYLEISNYLPLILALFAFLIFNWYPAKIFMGDSGSLFLGSVLTHNLVNTNNSSDFLNIAFITFPLIADATTCLLRRFCYGHNIFFPHKLHLYQRLYQSGWSHSKVALLYFISSLILGLISIFGDYHLSFFFITIIISIGVYLDKKVAIPFRKNLKL